MKVGSLFAGIGGFDLGLERAGFQTAWFCEQDEFCQQVLAKHWPDVPCYPDIRELRGQDVEPVEVLCGGFPCQDLSYAGRGAGIEGERSGLWSEYARLVGELRPRYVLVENVPALLTRGLGRVLGDLAALGYDAEWDCIPASAVGAPHRRDRIWLVAYPRGSGRRQNTRGAYGDEASDEGRRAQDDHIAVGFGSQRISAGRRNAGMADPDSEGPQGHGRLVKGAGKRLAPSRGLAQREREREREQHEWSVEPNVDRMANGVPSRVDRVKSLGNALVPQVAEWVGCRIQEWEEGR